MESRDPRIDDILRLLAEKQHKDSVRKNGESFGRYALKWVNTPERAMLVAALLWQLVGEFRDVQVQVAQVPQLAAAVSTQAEAAAAFATDQQQITNDLKVTTTALMEQNEILATTSKGLNDRLAVLRGDFTRTVQLQIIPRLEKIEKAQATAAAFSGEK